LTIAHEISLIWIVVVPWDGCLRGSSRGSGDLQIRHCFDNHRHNGDKKKCWQYTHDQWEEQFDG